MALCKISQFYDQATVELPVNFRIPSVLSVYIEHIAIQSMQKKFVNTEVYASRKRAIMAMAVKGMDTRTNFSLMHMAIVTTMY